MLPGAIYPNPANRAVKAFKTAFMGLPAIYWPFIPLAFGISPIWLSIPFILSAAGRLVRFGFISMRAGARICARVFSKNGYRFRI
jgi:hypothetical protein